MALTLESRADNWLNVLIDYAVELFRRHIADEQLLIVGNKVLSGEAAHRNSS
jgi:hypothetical protein